MLLRNQTRGTCPACGYPAAYVETVKNGRRLGWCASCQDRGAIAAILRGAGGDTHRAAENDSAAAQAAAERSRKAEQAQERARIIWSGAALVTADNPAGRYLIRRGLEHLTDRASLRYRDDVPHPAGGRHMALVAAVLNAAGALVGVHRTYLHSDGSKARLEPVKASLGPIWGGAIRLAPAAPEIVIGEGIETSASAGLLLGLPAWAAISAGNLGKGVILPPEVRSVVIAADDDGVNGQGRNPGIEASEAAAARWQREGRKVRIIKPATPGQDFNDVLLSRLANGEAAQWMT